MAGGLGIFIFFIFYRSEMLSLIKISITLLVILTIFGLITAFSPNFERFTLENMTGIIRPHKDATASWRMQGWQQQLSRLTGTSLLFGEGLGSYYQWSSKKTGKITVSPHNGYVQLILKFGLVGLFIYVLLVYKFLRTTLALRQKLPSGPVRAYMEAGILNFGAAHAYILGYGFTDSTLIFFGVAMGAVMVAEKTENSPMAARAQDISDLSYRPIVA